jgi:hypothetical protein
MKDIIITIPKTIKWEDYLKELKAAEQGEILNFKVRSFPNTGPGKRCYVVHDGHIKGYMIITGMSEKSFNCTTTGKHWSGKFIERTGKFYALKPIEMQGFRGFRYVND